jgi:hypothetical protein
MKMGLSAVLCGSIGVGNTTKLANQTLEKNLRDKMAMSIKEFIDFVAQLNAVVFLGLCRGKAPDYAIRGEYLNRLVEELVPISAYSLKNGVILGFEPIVFYLTNLLNTTDILLKLSPSKIIQ